MEKTRNAGKRGQVWVSAVLYILITVVAIVIILEAGNPIVNSLKDKTSFSKTKDAMQVLDQYIIDVAEEGPGSQRVVPLEISSGKVYIKNESLRWQIETSSKLMEPRTRLDLGNLAVIGSSTSSSVSAFESPDWCYYIIESPKLTVNMTVFGNVSKLKENCSLYVNTSKLINYIIFRENDTISSGKFNFRIGNDSSSGYGTGSTRLFDNGEDLASSSLRVYVNSSAYEYSLDFTLDSTSDFIAVKLANIRIK